MVGINSIFNWDIQVLLILIFTSKLDKNIIDIAIISTDAYCAASKLKKTQVFAVFMKT